MNRSVVPLSFLIYINDWFYFLLSLQARVLVTLGVKDSDAGNYVDFSLSRKLRVLCGRRKGTVMLLGGSWCKEIDGGDPLEVTGSW
jgi:hypothetical protein